MERIKDNYLFVRLDKSDNKEFLNEEIFSLINITISRFMFN